MLLCVSLPQAMAWQRTRFNATEVYSFAFTDMKVNGTHNWTNAIYYNEEARVNNWCNYFYGFQMVFPVTFP